MSTSSSTFATCPSPSNDDDGDENNNEVSQSASVAQNQILRLQQILLMRQQSRGLYQSASVAQNQIQQMQQTSPSNDDAASQSASVAQIQILRLQQMQQMRQQSRGLYQSASVAQNQIQQMQQIQLMRQQSRGLYGQNIVRRGGLRHMGPNQLLHHTIAPTHTTTAPSQQQQLLLQHHLRQQQQQLLHRQQQQQQIGQIGNGNLTRAPLMGQTAHLSRQPPAAAAPAQFNLQSQVFSKTMAISTVKDAFDRAAKKQKLSSSKSQEVIDQVGKEIEQALASIQSGSPLNKVAILADLKTKLNALRLDNQMEASEKELYINLSKYQKLLQKTLIADIGKAYRNVDFDHHILNQILARHFYLEGQFDMADSLVYEASESEDHSLRLQFVEMHQILEAMKSRNLQPALGWVSENREKLKDIGSNLELKLHGLQFVEILQSRCQTDAINYARTYLAPFAPLHTVEVQKLMGCLLYSGKLDTSPYSQLMDQTQWGKLADQLRQQFCSLLGQSHRSPLRVAIAAGVEGLPTLVKLANIMAVKKEEWHAMKQLPVPVELGKEFHFHSVFVCPVTREQSSEENPPMLLQCGHVLCKESIDKLSMSNTRTFKCPYCPFNASAAHCKQLYF